MKYIVLEGELISRDGKTKMEIPFIFANNLVHADMCEHFIVALRRQMKLSNVKPVSAGTFCVSNCTCSGESETLGLKSRPQDSGLVQFFDYSQGVV